MTFSFSVTSYVRDGKFGVVNLDYDQLWIEDDGSVKFHLSRPSKEGKPIDVRGLPATARFPVPKGGYETVTLYEPLERWMYALCKSRANMTEAGLFSSWRSLLSGGTPEHGNSARFFSDLAGTETNRSFVLGSNPDAEPIKVKPLACGGTIVKIVGETTVAGQPCWIIDVVDPFNFQATDPDVHYWRLCYPSISIREPIFKYKNGENDSAGVIFTDKYIESISEPFTGQFDGKAVIPMLGKDGRACIQKVRVKILSPDEPLPSPFVNAYVPSAPPFTTNFYPNPYGGR